ncbi:MAG: ABC transporter ATP-binding protein, partial [Kiritimatiellae bacterium]|jgi:ABC-2 type transport system ATP-binding protein|nr:ABC transporter ATP-binding protein [Kiritimatiellia bacterium]
LILDEPTIGLDPNQIVQIRNLIRDLAVSHTILITSHSLSEIEATCNRVIVMHKGKILESSPLTELGHRWFSGSQLRVEVKAEAAEVEEVFRSMEDLKSVAVVSEGEWACAELVFVSDADYREEVYLSVQDRGWVLRELVAKRHSLEEAFVNMTSGDSGS